MSALAPLSEREVQVLELLTEGLKDREIGKRLGYSRGTIKNCLSSIYVKFGLWDTDLNKRVAAATRYARGTKEHA